MFENYGRLMDLIMERSPELVICVNKKNNKIIASRKEDNYCMFWEWLLETEDYKWYIIPNTKTMYVEYFK